MCNKKGEVGQQMPGAKKVAKAADKLSLRFLAALCQNEDRQRGGISPARPLARLLECQDFAAAGAGQERLDGAQGEQPFHFAVGEDRI